tara:strand:- start:1212 stop:1430 length:219 start_codon:yes stop_codon:yes gene_type:complete
LILTENGGEGVRPKASVYILHLTGEPTRFKTRRSIKNGLSVPTEASLHAVALKDTPKWKNTLMKNLLSNSIL